MHRYARYALVAMATAGMWLAGSAARAQGNPDWKQPPGSGNKAKVKAISTNDGAIVAREILIKHGYEVIRVDVDRDRRVIYYRLGNRGKGKGKGRLMKMIVRPDRERLVFIDVPRPVLVEINVRLGY